MIRPISLSVSLLLLASACSDYELAPADKASPDGEQVGDTPLDSGTPVETAPGETGSIKGRVCDTSGDGWVVGATVYVIIDYDGDGVEDDRITTTTDSDGYFLLEGVPMGHSTVYVEKGSFSTTFEVTLDEPGVTELSEEECLTAEDVKIAVITGQYDSIEHILDDLGLEYDTYKGVNGTAYVDFLTDSAAMAEYDIIFLNCGIANGWVTRSGEVGTNIKDFVEGGGSIYASDWAYFLFEKGFPDAVDYYGDDTVQGSAWVGQSTTINADVLDANIAAIVGGSKAELNFNLVQWVVPTSAKSTVDVLLEGKAPLLNGSNQADSPLAVRFEKGGTALYTTFHNEAQTTVDMDAILEEFIFSL